MKTAHISILFLLLFSMAARAEEPAPATSSATGLVGRWKAIAIGEKKVPADISIYWTIDEEYVVVTTANGDVATRSRYTTESDGDHQIIRLTIEGETEPDRVGWYEFEEGNLRIQLTLGTGEPPTEWNEKEVMVLAPAPKGE